MRASIGDALAGKGAVYRDIDMCVPLVGLYQYIMLVEAICDRYEIKFACFGHALDGNLHVMLFCKQHPEPEEELAYNSAIREIYYGGVRLGGVISGEHGIGFLQKEFLPLQCSEPQLSLMKRIKTAFDPNGILNPGKII